jgi:hypothetical protein
MEICRPEVELEVGFMPEADLDPLRTTPASQSNDPD